MGSQPYLPVFLAWFQAEKERMKKEKAKNFHAAQQDKGSKKK